MIYNIKIFFGIINYFKKKKLNFLINVNLSILNQKKILLINLIKLMKKNSKKILSNYLMIYNSFVKMLLYLIY